ncbi:hypothetical protein GWK47_016054 [Chionoecetes opilio]|uniref:Uncharacterized protein n=1 Tax=Chionoecetes opilio TaxID=41210 RepID=A0A8J4XRQ2_CHIOP|nr:hypothetical protein GWK47_016054 [Chionoecetes opilio]
MTAASQSRPPQRDPGQHFSLSSREPSSRGPPADNDTPHAAPPAAPPGSRLLQWNAQGLPPETSGVPHIHLPQHPRGAHPRPQGRLDLSLGFDDLAAGVNRGRCTLRSPFDHSSTLPPSQRRRQIPRHALAAMEHRGRTGDSFKLPLTSGGSLMSHRRLHQQEEGPLTAALEGQPTQPFLSAPPGPAATAPLVFYNEDVMEHNHRVTCTESCIKTTAQPHQTCGCCRIVGDLRSAGFPQRAREASGWVVRLLQPAHRPRHCGGNCHDGFRASRRPTGRPTPHHTSRRRRLIGVFTCARLQAAQLPPRTTPPLHQQLSTTTRVDAVQKREGNLTWQTTSSRRQN